jgi:hypothetical protein
MSTLLSARPSMAVGEAVDGYDHRGAVAFEHCAGYVVERLACCNAQACSDGVCGDPVVGDRDELVEQGQGVAHRARCLTGDH